MIMVGSIELLGERRDLASMEAMDANPWIHGLMMIDAFFHMKDVSEKYDFWKVVAFCAL